MYHSLHDTIYWMENFVDKEYKIHLTVAKVGLQYLLQLADLPILPISTTKYGEGLRRAVKAIVEKFNNTKVKGNETGRLGIIYLVRVQYFPKNWHFVPSRNTCKIFCVLTKWIASTLKFVSVIFIKFLFFHQIIGLQKLWKMFFISSKKLFSFSRYSHFCNFFPSFPHFPDSKWQMGVE